MLPMFLQNNGEYKLYEKGEYEQNINGNISGFQYVSSKKNDNPIYMDLITYGGKSHVNNFDDTRVLNH